MLNGGAPTPEAALASALPATTEAYAAIESDITSFCTPRYHANDPGAGTLPGHAGRRYRRSELQHVSSLSFLNSI